MLLLFIFYIYTDVILCSKRNQASDFWRQPEQTSEFESDFQDTVDWARKRLANFSVEKTQLVLNHCSNNTDSIKVKIHASVFDENQLF